MNPGRGEGVVPAAETFSKINEAALKSFHEDKTLVLCGRSAAPEVRQRLGLFFGEQEAEPCSDCSAAVL